MSFVNELKRRNVFRMAVLYAVSSWLLLQVGDVLFDLMALPDWSLRLLLAILLLGFPVALIFSWVYELTPEGLKREREIDRSQSATAHTAKKLDLAVIALMVISLGVFLADRAGMLPHGGPEAEVVPASVDPPQAAVADSPAPDDSSIAVLPFVNMSSDPEQEYFSDGLAESLLHMLAQIRDLRVAARTSSFRFKNHTGDISEIGRQLNVAHVLEGSVRRSGDKLRVTAQLIKADDGYHLWSGTYDREMDDIFTIQDDIASRVVAALKTALLGAEDADAELQSASASLQTDNLEAYEAYLRGREQLFIDSYGSLSKAEAFLRQALDLDPNYVLAMVSLADAYKSMANTGLIAGSVASEHMTRIGNRIMALQPESAAGQAMLAMAKFPVRGDREPVDRAFLKAYEADPDDPFVALTYGEYLGFTGRDEQALAVLNRALERDPMSPELHVRLALIYDRLDPEKALAHAARARALEPANPNALHVEARVQAHAGQFVSAIDTMQRVRELDPEDYEIPADIALYLIAFGQTDAAGQYIETAQAMSADGILPIAAEALLLHRQGKTDDAADLIRQAIAAGIEPRRWAWPVAVSILQAAAIEARNPDLYLEPIGQWLDVEFATPEIDHGGQMFPKLMAVPVLRAAGENDRAQALVERGQDFATRKPDDRDDPVLAMVTGDVEKLLDLLQGDLDRGDLNPLDWMFFSQPAIRELAGDNPRYRALMDRLKSNEREQARLWEQNRDGGEAR